MLPLFDDPPAPVVAVERIGPGHPCYHAYWSGFAKGIDGQGRPGPEPDERVTRYIFDGWRLGRLCRLEKPR